jgi:hypothetical protein
MEREDIAETAPRLLDDLRCRTVNPAGSAIAPVDQRIQLFRRNLVEAPKVGHDAPAALADVVSKRLDKLQILAVACPGDARLHYVAPASFHCPSNQYAQSTMRVTTSVAKSTCIHPLTH